MCRESLDASDVHCLMVLSADLSRSVVRVLHFHSGVGRSVDRSRGILLFARANCHVHFEAGVHLILAILDAGLLGWALCCELLDIDAVEVAAAEEQLGE